MAINRDLNVSPYFDDFDETKQYHRVLFKPARPVQARELTQLQTILQNQIERFGSNIYKEGTTISGTDIYDISDLRYIKLDDDVSGINGVSVESFLPRLATVADAQSNAGVTEDDYLTFTLEGGTTRLVAEIVNASEGFVTRNPDLKTFFIKYRGTTDGQPIGTLKEFDSGEELTIRSPFGTIIGTITVSTLTGYAGSARGVGVSDGVIYQKGHFLYVEPQTIIISKYTEDADNISVGFDVEELIVNSNQDATLLDNSQGFLNKNAPGADRLRLRPFLVSHPSNNEPENFFALARYKNGVATQIRNVTQFNSIEKELSRRTYDQSGNYVSRGMKCAIEPGVGEEVLASVSPGTGYSNGYELTIYGTEYFTIDPVEETNEADAVFTSVQYGNYLTVAPNGLTIAFDIDNGTVYNLYTASDVLIGTCNVRNIEDQKIYIYNVRKAPNLSPSDTIAKIGTSTSDAITVTSSINDVRNSPMIFSAAGKGIKSVSEITYSRRVRLPLSGSDPTDTFNLAYFPDRQPINNNKIVFINQVNQQVNIQTRTVINDGQGNPATLQITLTEQITPTNSYVYYDENTINVTPNTKTSVETYMKTNYNAQYRRASLGVCDAYQLISVGIFRIADSTVIEDVTGKFTLVPNQKDTFYDISYIELKGGQSITLEAGQVLLARFKVFRHDYTTGGGFFTAESYVNIPREDIPVYNGSNGVTYDLVSSFDFRVGIKRPELQQFSTTIAGASTAINYALQAELTATEKLIETGTLVSPSNSSNITAKIETYLSRVDQIVIDSSGKLVYKKGKAAKNPSAEITPDLVLAEISVPSNPVRLTGPYAPRLKNKGIKAYTMRDISKIESTIDRLVELSALAMLKSSGDDMIVTDSSGLDRFKNGVLVDSFKNLKIADVTDPEFFAGVDQFRERATPPHKQFPIPLKRGASSNSSAFSEIVTKAVAGTETLLSQPYATTYRNAVFGSYKYIGNGELHPRYDGGYDMTVNPAPATINIDFETPIVELADNIMELMRMTGADTRVVVDEVLQNDVRGTNSAGDAGTNLVTTINETHTQFNLTSSSQKQAPQVVGQFLTDANFKPFMEEKEIRVLIYGLRPNIRHYFYFEQDDVNAMVKPGASVEPSAGNVRANQVVSGGDYGDPVYSNNFGVLTAIFKLPAETYLVGDRKLEIASVDSYAAMSSAADSYASLVYSAHNFDLNSQVLTVNTRTAEFDVAQVGQPFPVSRDFISRFTPDPPRRNRDPLAQTFYLQRSAVEGNRYIYLDSIELFFKSKSSERGVNIEIREVLNGYPARQIVPFGQVHYDPNDANLQDIINVSDDGSAGTLFRFPNPVRLETEREYCVVVRPDANDPGYNLFTAKLGQRDLQTNRSITADWGDGVLFSSTNNLTWVPHADEDLKFNVNIHTFSTQASTFEFVPDDMEFFTISGTTGQFRLGEIAFSADQTTTVDVGIFVATPNVIETSSGADVNIQVGQYAVLQSGLRTWVSKVVNVNGDQLTIEEPAPFSGPATMTRAVGGVVTHFNKFRPTSIDLRKSTAAASYPFVAGTLIYGATSGAFATIVSVDDVELSSIQGHMYKAESQNATVDFDVYNGPNREGDLPLNDDYYFINTTRVVESKSNIVTGTAANFSIIANMRNANKYTTPVIDDDISMLFGYKYLVTNNEDTTAKWVTREVTLNSDLYAEGLRVRAGIHRPQGSEVKVYARFKYRDNAEQLGPWILLTNESPDLYSNSSSLYDYREFDFNLPESEEREYVSFKLKFVMLAESVNRTPSMIDYRAIAVT